MDLVLVRHLWGVDLPPEIDVMFREFHAFGYRAIEYPLPSGETAVGWKRKLEACGMEWIPQIYGPLPHEGLHRVTDHVQRLHAQLETCVDGAPLLVNAHSGYDAWTPAEAEDFYGTMLDLERSFGLRIAHETHRGRYLGLPWQAGPILERYPDLCLTVDFSHWVCTCERLLPDLEATVRLAAQRAIHIHARVGYEQGPQVPDPTAPEYRAHLEAHERWWDWVWTEQEARGLTASTLTPEFGPPDYLHTLPHTNVPVADLATICDGMARRQRERFARRAAP